MRTLRLAAVSLVPGPSLVRLVLSLVACAQVKDKWAFQMTARYEMYRDLLTEYCKPDYQPQIIRDPSL